MVGGARDAEEQAGSDSVRLYGGGKQSLIQLLERVQRTAADILEAAVTEGKGQESTADAPARGAVDA